jgi:hypothetical protein
MALSVPSVYEDAESRQNAYHKATDHLLFTKDFNTALEAWRDDPLETPAARLLAWVKRSSWGRWSLYCVDEAGKPAYQVNAAADLHLDKRRVSDTVDYLVKRGYIGKDGKVLYPVISPVPADIPFRSDPKSEEHGLFLEQWKVAHSTDFHEFEVARSLVKTYRKVLLSEYKKWKALRTNAAPSLLEEEEGLEEDPTPSQPVLSEPEPIPEPEEPAGRLVVVPKNIPSTQNPPEEVRGEVRAYMENIVRPGLTKEIVDEVASHITTKERLEAFKHESRPAVTQHAKTWKYWVKIAKRVAEDAPRYEKAKAGEGNGHSPPERPLTPLEQRAKAYAAKYAKGANP